MSKLAEIIVWTGTRPRPSSPRVTPGAFGASYEDIRFHSASRDGVHLSGWLIRPAGPAIGVVVLCHGHVSTRCQLLKQALMLSKHHFTTVLFDFRARGMSQGTCCTMGQLEMFDVIGALDFLYNRSECAGLPAFLLGNSMGGAACILAAARDARVRAVIAEGTFANLRSVVRHRVKLASGPVSSRLTDQCAAIGRSRLSLDIDAVNPADVIRKIAPRPLLLITDGLDLTCPRRESDRLFQAAGEPKHRWIAAAAPHTMAYRIYPQQYEQVVVTFLNQAIAGVERSHT